ncbi:MAG TPA: NapC/NirT family cytochrome c [Polyangiales bacterium]|nr:NapC/NirT family cytochrome c [Polyangiales bacterium]
MHISPLSWIALASALVAAAIMINYLVRKPKLTGPVKVTLFIGIGVLPIITALVGNIEGLAATEHHEFCGSCHTMDMWLEDANDPDSMSLAAIHSRTKKFGDKSCYVCHKDYGMFGYALTKLGGMGHVYQFLTEFMWMDADEALSKVHIARPFKNENCMQCHSTTGNIWNGVPDHRGLLNDLRTGQTSCASAGCHGYAHPFSKTDEEHPSPAEAQSSEELSKPEET